MTWRPAVVATPSTFEPLSLEDAKLHLRVTDDDDDQSIADYAKAAKSYIQFKTGLYLASQTLTLKTNTFNDFCKLPVAPVASITSITYTDPDAAPQTLATSVYEARLEGLSPLIVLKTDQAWPSIELGSQIVLTVVVGFATPDDMPHDILSALKLLLGTLYMQREDVSATGLVAVPAADALLVNYRIFA